ncbi:MAG: phosphoribosylamine--glycine ligase [Bacteroidales bacterium]|nr:phosphoribosylamine--glycine ligase [Bacteroidales bacterium]
MNILILGGGGREHAIAWKLKQSKKVKKIFIAPGNAGTLTIGKNLPVDSTDFHEIKTVCIENLIDLVIVGSETPLVAGIVDYFHKDDFLRQINIIGPDKTGAQLEGSKAFAKTFMNTFDIPTAAHFTVNAENLAGGIEFLRQQTSPYVLKANGLAAGKGVLIIRDIEEAENELKLMLEGKFGQASNQVVIEQFLEGIELSFFVLTDGESYKILPSAKDYKRAGEGDTGLNTGGMGAVSPVIFADQQFIQKVEDRIVKPTMRGLKEMNIHYKGFIFIGLMNVKGEPYVIEYNVRLGDPEAECIIPRINTDFSDLMMATGNGTLSEIELEIDERYAVTIMLVSGGYPGEFKRGKKITGLNNTKDCVVFHAGTTTDIETEGIKTAGGRVIAVTAKDYRMDGARNKALANAEKILFEGRYFRRDIGLDLMNYIEKY